MAYIQILSGELKGKKLNIECDDFTIGRSSKNVLAISDPSVSGKHCVIHREGRKYTLKDLGSTNGTTLNDVPIESFQLSREDKFAAGSVDMRFDGQDVEDAVPTPGDIPPTIVAPRPATRTQTSAAGEGGAAAFGAKKNSKVSWIIVLSIIGVLVFAALAWFVAQLMRG